MIGRILLWAAILLISAGLIATLIVWLAPLVAAVAVLYVAGKIMIFRSGSSLPQNYSGSPIDSR